MRFKLALRFFSLAALGVFASVTVGMPVGAGSDIALDKTNIPRQITANGKILEYSPMFAEVRDIVPVVPLFTRSGRLASPLPANSATCPVGAQVSESLVAANYEPAFGSANAFASPIQENGGGECLGHYTEFVWRECLWDCGYWWAQITGNDYEFGWYFGDIVCGCQENGPCYNP